MGRFGKRLAERAGAGPAAPKGPATAGPPIWVRLSVWGGIGLLLAAPVLAVPEWMAREPDGLFLGLAGVCAALGVGSITLYFTKVGSL